MKIVATYQVEQDEQWRDFIQTLRPDTIRLHLDILEDAKRKRIEADDFGSNALDYIMRAINVCQDELDKPR